MPTSKRSNHKDGERVMGEAPGTVDDVTTDSTNPTDTTDTATDVTTGTAGPVEGELGTGVAHAPQMSFTHTSTVRLPFVTASFTRSSEGPGVPGPMDALAGAGHLVGAVVSAVPRNRVLFYGGVAALGVAGIVDWPVAALVATGTYVASRSRGRDARPTISADRSV